MAQTTSNRLPRVIWLLLLGVFVNRFGSFVTVFLVLYLTHIGYTPVQAGIAVSAYGIGSLGAATGGGQLADRLGRKYTIVLSMFSSGAAMLALSQARALWLIVILTGLAGLTTEMYRPAVSALLTDLVPAERRVTAFALYRLAVNLGFAAGPVIAGFLASHSFFLLFVGDACTSLFFGVVSLLFLPHGARSQREQEAPGEFRRTMLADRAFLLFLLAYLAFTFIYFQNQTTFALQVQSFGYSPAVYGTLISVNGLVIILLELPLSTVTRRLPTRPTIAVGMLLSAIGFALTSIAITIPLLALTVTIWTLGEIVESPVAAAYVANLAPAHLRGRYQGTYSLIWSIGLITAPLLGTTIFTWNHQALWLACGALGLFGALLVWLSGNRWNAAPGEKDASPTTRETEPV